MGRNAFNGRSNYIFITKSLIIKHVIITFKF